MFIHWGDIGTMEKRRETTIVGYVWDIGYILGLFWDYGKQNGKCNLGSRVCLQIPPEKLAFIRRHQHAQSANGSGGFCKYGLGEFRGKGDPKP